jgi:hypothetical protein
MSWSTTPGHPYHPDTLGDFWRELCSAAKVRQIRLHDPRHSCASIMHAQAVPIAVISAWLGHADPAFTMRTYVHAQDDALKAATATLQKVDAPIPVKKSSGGQPLAVVVGEGVVALVSAFEPRDGDDRDAEMVGDGG